MMTAAPTEERLTGGAFNQVTRIGDTVRREKTGAWTRAVHALLRHLEHAGFDGAPRARGIDDQGREILTFVPGETVTWSGEAFDADDLVLAAGRLLRRYHDTAQSFVPPSDVTWQDSWFDDAAPREVPVAAAVAAEVVCHNDYGPHNVIVVGGVPTALIDWDFARPAPRAWDIAYGMKSYAPLPSEDEIGSAHRSLAVRGRRMRLFCEGYGLANPEDRRGLLEMAECQLRTHFTALKTKAVTGDPFCVAAWANTNGGQPLLANLAYLREHHAVLQAALDGRDA